MKCRHVVSVCGAALVASLGGCREPDPQLGQLATEVIQEQGQQNRRIAEGSRALAEGSQRLVAGDAQARRELIELQQGLRQDQTEVARQRDALEAERQSMARQRRTDSLLRSSLVVVGWILACLAPLILAGLALLGMWREPTREEEGQILIEQLAQVWADAPAAYVPPSPLEREPAGRLPRPQARDPTRD